MRSGGQRRSGGSGFRGPVGSGGSGFRGQWAVDLGGVQGFGGEYWILDY